MESAAEGLLHKAHTADADFGSGPGSWGCMGRRASMWPPDVLAQGRNSRLVALGVERQVWLEMSEAGKMASPACPQPWSLC